jgi:hypothetical protein
MARREDTLREAIEAAAAEAAARAAAPLRSEEGAFRLDEAGTAGERGARASWPRI